MTLEDPEEFRERISELAIGQFPPGKYSFSVFSKFYPEMPKSTLSGTLMALSDDPDVNLTNIGKGWWEIDD